MYRLLRILRSENHWERAPVDACPLSVHDGGANRLCRPMRQEGLAFRKAPPPGGGAWPSGALYIGARRSVEAWRSGR